jgi:single-strand DNA-binding protein
MQTVNRFTIYGNINTVTQFEKSLKVSVATHREYKDKQGVDQKETDWTTLTILNEAQINHIKNKANTGDKVFAEGYIKNSDYMRQGQRVFTTDLITQKINLIEKQSAS